MGVTLALFPFKCCNAICAQHRRRSQPAFIMIMIMKLVSVCAQHGVAQGPHTRQVLHPGRRRPPPPRHRLRHRAEAGAHGAKRHAPPRLIAAPIARTAHLSPPPLPPPHTRCPPARPPPPSPPRLRRPARVPRPGSRRPARVARLAGAALGALA